MLFVEDGYALSTVHEWMRAFRCGRTDVQDVLHIRRPSLEELNDRIPAPLEDNQFHSCRSLGELLAIDVSSVHRHLTEYMAMNPLTSKRQPLELTDHLKQKQVAICRELLDASKEEQTLDLR
jgi:formamidopyrimidine-DNA glycosylase